jgi:hypothetical protein
MSEATRVDDIGASEPQVALVAGRSCGGCTMCCKVLGIKELDKPQFKWCPHCAIGEGCTIYERRPGVCRSFYCGYLLDAALGEHWFPARSKMVVTTNAADNTITIFVDSTRLDAWRREPFFTQIRRWAADINARHGQCIVRQGSDTIVVLPHGAKNLGPVPDGHAIVVVRAPGPAGTVWDALAVPPDDPRLAEAKARRNAAKAARS